MSKKRIKINIQYGFKDALLILIGIFVFCYSVDVFVNNYDSKSPINPINPTADYSEGEVKDFLMVAQRFADNHNYSEQEYNCRNYTRDLKKIADELGFDVEQVIGCNSSSSSNRECHTWLKLKVDFEPQHAEFVDYSKEYPYQSKRK